jgi:DNA-binding winged helix-turn-helix (wHTH) protein/tetratricopeptide (TPR) repeat protein
MPPKFAKNRSKYLFGEFQLDLAQRTFLRDGRPIGLQPRSFDLLSYLVQNSHRVVTKEELMDELWSGSLVEESNLGQHIFLLRKALTASQQGDRLLVSVPGRGYQFAAPVMEVPEAVLEGQPGPVTRIESTSSSQATPNSDTRPRPELRIQPDSRIHPDLDSPTPVFSPNQPPPTREFRARARFEQDPEAETAAALSPVLSPAPSPAPPSASYFGQSALPPPAPETVRSSPSGNLALSPSPRPVSPTSAIPESLPDEPRADRTMPRARFDVDTEPVSAPSDSPRISAPDSETQPHPTAKSQPEPPRARRFVARSESEDEPRARDSAEESRSRLSSSSASRRSRRFRRDEDDEPESIASGPQFRGYEEEEPSALARTADSFFHPGPTQFAILTALAVLLCAGAWFGWRYLHRPQGDALTLVLGDLENTTGLADFDPALRTALAIDLQQSPFLDLATGDKIRDALRNLRQPIEQRLTPALARSVCQQIHGQVYLTGEVSRFADKYLVELRAFDCRAGQSSGATLAQSKGLADSGDEVVSVLDRVTLDLRSQLGEPGKSLDRFNKPLFAGRPASLAVLKAYSDASLQAHAGKSQDAALLYARVLQLDPKFTMAYVDLGALYSRLGDPEQAKVNLTRAYELRDTVDEQDRFLIVALYNREVTGDLPSSLKNLKSWSELYPHNTVPLLNLADLTTQIGKAGQAVEPARRAVEIDPSNPAGYVLLARAQLRVEQSEETTATCRLAITRHADSPAIHALLYEVAYLRLDQPAMDEQIAWARDSEDSSAVTELTLEEARMEFAVGKVRTAQATLATLIDNDRKQGLTDRANRLLASLPRAQADLGYADSAQKSLQKLAASGDSTLADPVDVAVAWALVGEPSRAEAILAGELAAHPSDTLWQEDYGPEIRSAVALSQQKPQPAIDALQVATPYDLRSFDLPSLRGRAYLAARDFAQAETEFHKILDHPGVEPLSYNYPLAQLGLARSLAGQGKTEEATFAYKVLLQIWKEADPDLPRLKAAQSEYAHLGTSGKSVSSAARTTPAKARRK